MRIETLAFRGIGPFIGEHKIDFSLLGSDALFLIEGPTGAGKSTILDAIAYGIYGEPAAANSDIGRMRSHHLADTEKSWVQVVFSTRNATFKVTRSPKYLRVKERGTGFIEEKSSLRVEKLDGSGKFKTIYESVDAGNTYLQQQVGLDRTQFAQTVLLPQGQFDKFLKSETKERQPLLEKIFRTEKYTQIMDALARRSKESAAIREEIKQELREAISSLGGATGLDPDEVNELTNLAEIVEKDGELRSRIQELLDAAEQDFSNSEQALELTNAKYVKLEEALAQRRLEEGAKIALENAQTEFEAIEEQLEDSVAKIKSRYELELLDLGFKIDSLSPNLTRERETALKVSEGLIEAVALEQTLDDSLADLSARKNQISEAEQELKQQEEWANTAPKELEVLTLQLKATRELAANSDKLQFQKQLLEGELESIEQNSALEEKLGKLKPELPIAVQVARQSTDLQHQLVTQRLDNAAGLLAKELEDGDPCKVCGSTKHPAKAKLFGKEISDEDIEAASDKAQKDSAKVATLKQQIEEIEQNLHAKKNGKVSVRPKEAVEKDLDETSAAIAKSEQAVSEASKLDLEHSDFVAEIERVKAQIGDAKTSIATMKAELASKESDVIAMKAKVLKAKREYDSVASRKAALDELADSIGELGELVKEFEQVKGSLKTAKSALEALPRVKNFAQVDDAISALEGLKPTRDAEVSNVAQQEARLKSFRKGLKSIEKIQKDRRKAIAGSEDLVNLAKLASGDNPYKQKLPTYVLQSMFEDVLVAANARFEKVLEGRFKFETAELQGSMSKKQGLGLEILDQTLGKSVNPTALSGGESFCAALSLALGLSDVVRANQGGIAIDTFFIDEGFGSLDPTRLNQVMNMLTQLKAEGRTIGLISHVEDMKEAIPEKVEVRPIVQSGPSTLSVNWM